MSTATVRLSDHSAIALDAVMGNYKHATAGILLTLEGRTPGPALNCVVIPTDKIGVVIASLELVRKQLGS